jgi:hypothetical protein
MLSLGEAIIYPFFLMQNTHATYSQKHFRHPPFFDELDCIDQLGDSILGKKIWSDAAHSITKILLGRNRDLAWNYVTTWRETMRISIQRQWAHLKEVEIASYGSKSYFYEGTSDLESEMGLVSIEDTSRFIDSGIEMNEETHLSNQEADMYMSDEVQGNDGDDSVSSSTY